MTRLTLRARYVFPVTSAPIADGAVTIENGRIAAVGTYADRAEWWSAETRDLGNAAILPAFVNAHTHLDFSKLTKPLGEKGIGFVDWLRLVMEFRRSASVEGAVDCGLRESLNQGVTTLGEIGQGCEPWESAACGRSSGESSERPPLSASDDVIPTLNVTLFRELIAPTADRVAGVMELAHVHLRRRAAMPTSDDWHVGLSPHAPYSAHPELLKAAVALSAAARAPIAMHLAESREEIELLRHGTGPLRHFLAERGICDAAGAWPGLRPMECLRLLASAHRAMVIHGNYLEDEEIAFLAARAERMAVVYCPRTHDWFGHRAYPLEKMLALGVRIALGTDGRGLSPDLSLLAEMRLVARRHPSVELETILRMGTLIGAEVLGWERRVGSLDPGKQADLAIVGLPDREAADPHTLLLASDEPVVGCCHRGNPGVSLCSPGRRLPGACDVAGD
jgi:cytosine/adenosine deaminase-related metal-dependent hydrolase